MVENKSNSLLILQILLASVSVLATVALARKVVNFHNKLWLAIIVFIVAVLAFTYLSVTIPLYFMGDSERVQYNLSIDLILFGAIGLIAVGILGFAMDHLYERPTWLVVAAAAIFSIGLAPFYYQVFSTNLNSRFEIKIVEPETVPDSNLPPPLQ